MPMPSVTALLNSRQLWLKIHLILALSVGLLFAILGFTGSIIVYNAELDELLNPDLVISQPSSQTRSFDELITALKRAHPTRHGEWTLEMPRSAHSMVTAWFEKPSESYFKRYAPLMVSVNPYTAEVVRSRFWGRTFVTWCTDLHSQLQLGSVGWELVGYLGIALVLSILSGLYLWWPRTALNTKQSFSLSLPRSRQHWLIFLHRHLGLLSSVPLLLIACTGSLLSYPEIMTQLTGASGMAHGETGAAITSTAEPNIHVTSLTAAEFMARAVFPNATLRRITTPVGATGVYRINYRHPQEINQRHPYATVWVDRWSGQIKAVRNPKQFSWGESLSSWLWPLHTGEAFGAPGKLLMFITGQSLFWLYLTGLFRWLYRTGKLADSRFNFSYKKHLQASVAGFKLATELGRACITAGIQHALPLLNTLRKILWLAWQRGINHLRQTKNLPKP